MKNNRGGSKCPQFFSFSFLLSFFFLQKKSFNVVHKMTFFSPPPQLFFFFPSSTRLNECNLSLPKKRTKKKVKGGVFFARKKNGVTTPFPFLFKKRGVMVDSVDKKWFKDKTPELY